MVRVINAHPVITGEKRYYEYAGNENDTKPTPEDLATGSTFLEVDTGDVYAYDEDSEQWNKIASLGGDS